MNFWIVCFMTVFMATCKPGAEQEKIIVTAAVRDTTDIIVGAERLSTFVPMLKGKKVGVVCNQTSMVGSAHLIDTLLKLGVQIDKIFSPEHGIRGKADAGEKVDNSKDQKTGIPIISLYGATRKPLQSDINTLDIVVFDIQDVGVRFYTYISTLHYVMEACAENNVPVIVLDRPNPNGYFIDGPVLEQSFASFVGMHSVPVVYGMTIGEYAKMINGEKWLTNGVQANLTVVEMKHYNHDSYYELPVKPSPNLPDMRSILLYPSVCFFEGTPLSLGRGTDKPFQYIGHPSLVSDFAFTPQPNEGAKSPPLQGKICYGKDLSGITIGSIRDRKQLDLALLIDFYVAMKSKGQDFFLQNHFFDKLAGTDRLRLQIEQGMEAGKIRQSWQPGIDTFKKIRKKYLLYP
ncbi:MAG: DUF1343 domain-containing protein [Saprospiraceae bacterium]